MEFQLQSALSGNAFESGHFRTDQLSLVPAASTLTVKCTCSYSGIETMPSTVNL
jgi:hypothetical protein